MIKTVFLDMDGVLVNFIGGMNECMNIPKDTIPTKWDWWTDYGFAFKQINEFCNTQFWQQLQWMPDSIDILRAIGKHFNVEDIYLLTTPMPNVQSPTGKWLWVRDNLPEFYKRTIITQAPKSLLARPDTLLIDDKDENVIEFREAGGKAILVPRSWNFLYNQADKSLEIVKQSLEKI